MQLISTLNSWDTNLFLSINGCNSPFFDGFMYGVSYKLTWIPLYLSVLYIVIKQWKKESIWVILSLVLCIVISDQISSGLIKNLVQRLRPSHVEQLKGVIHLVNNYSGGQYGFVSSHSANAVGFALLSSLLFKRRTYTISIFTWALLTAYSRIYLGVHYPLDVLGGALVGTLAALFCFWLLKRYFSNVFEQAIDANKPLIPVWILTLSFVGIIVYSFVFLVMQ